MNTLYRDDSQLSSCRRPAPRKVFCKNDSQTIAEHCSYTSTKLISVLLCALGCVLILCAWRKYDFNEHLSERNCRLSCPSFLLPPSDEPLLYSDLARATQLHPGKIGRPRRGRRGRVGARRAHRRTQCQSVSLERPSKQL